MTPRFEIAALLLMTIVPIWICAIVVEVTWKQLTVGVLALLSAAACFYFRGFETAILVIAATYCLGVAFAVLQATVARFRRARLADGSRPEQADLERWARKELCKQEWVVVTKSSPSRLVARKKSFAETHVFCVANYTKIGTVHLRDIGEYAQRTKSPVILLLFGGAPSSLVTTMRNHRLLPISPRDFPSHVAAAPSRDDLVKSCRTAVIEEVTPGMIT